MKTIIRLTVYLFAFCLMLIKFLEPTPEKTMKVYVDTSSPVTRRAIVVGLMDWQSELDNFNWEFSNDRENSVVFRDWNPGDTIQQINGGSSGNTSHWLAVTYPTENLVIFNRWPDGNIYETAIHEIGHVLIGRLEHNDDKRSVMYPIQQPTSQDILPSDLKWLTSRYHVRVRNSITFDAYSGSSFSIFMEAEPVVLNSYSHDIVFMRQH